MGMGSTVKVLTDELQDELGDGFTRFNRACVAVAFITGGGLLHGNFDHAIIRFLKARGQLRILTDVTQGLTDPGALELILRWRNRFGELVQCRLYPPDKGNLFHPKLYVFSRDNCFRIIVGSPNWTREAMASNIEAALAIEAPARRRKSPR